MLQVLKTNFYDMITWSEEVVEIQTSLYSIQLHTTFYLGTRVSNKTGDIRGVYNWRQGEVLGTCCNREIILLKCLKHLILFKYYLFRYVQGIKLFAHV